MNEIDEKVKYWVELAQYDIDTAYAMLKTKRYLYVGFMCHQSAEKALKGYYVNSLEKTAPYTHNLTLLAKHSGLYDDFSEEQKDLLDLLEPLNIEARYPTQKEKMLKSLDENTCKEIYSKTEELFTWIKQRLY